MRFYTWEEGLEPFHLIKLVLGGDTFEEALASAKYFGVNPAGLGVPSSVSEKFELVPPPLKDIPRKSRRGG